MDESDGSGRFRELPTKEQDRYLAIVRELTAFAQDHAIPICFAPKLGTFAVPLGGGKICAVTLPMSLGKIDGASGCVLRLESGVFVVTADHVLREYEARIDGGEELNWQVGKLPPFDPRSPSRKAWRDKANDQTPAQEPSSLMPYRPRDIVLLRLSEQEATHACGVMARIVPTPSEWPPAPLTVGQMVVLAGYANQLREEDQAGTMTRGACSAVFRVTTVGDGYCKCQFEYHELINFSTGSPLPDLSAVSLGGMSGGPVFVLVSSGVQGKIQYPRLAGVFTDRLGAFSTSDVIEIATFDGVYERDFRPS